MSTFEVIILAIVQGITEFLPISSDGHLVRDQRTARGLGPTARPHDLLEVELVLHLGTLAAVLVFYRREIVRVLTTGRRAIVPLIWGTIPAGIIGVGIKKGLPDEPTNSILGSPLLAGIGFLITAAVLCWGTRRMTGQRRYDELRPAESLFIGLMQAIAILPGVSRSGLTIGSGLARGLEREARRRLLVHAGHPRDRRRRAAANPRHDRRRQDQHADPHPRPRLRRVDDRRPRRPGAAAPLAPPRPAHGLSSTISSRWASPSSPGNWPTLDRRCQH